jgi:hypothetical protein
VNEKVDKGAPQFDWVAERSACSLPKVFKDLGAQLAADVKTRNALRPNNSPYEFSVKEDVSDITVVLQAADVRKSIIFNLTAHSILVRDDEGNQLFEVTLTFTDDGKCRLNVNEQPREPWQVRRMALEELFFAPS